MKPLIVHRKGELFLNEGGLSAENLPEEFQKTFPELSPKYIDPVSLLAGITAGRILRESGFSAGSEMGQDFAVIVGSAFGAIDSTVNFDAQALEKGPNAVNPMDFPNTVANAAGSRIGIWMRLKGPNVTLTNGGTSLLDAVGFAWEGYNSGLFSRCLVGAVEKVPVFLKPLASSSAGTGKVREGSCFLQASGVETGETLFRVRDYFALQLKPNFEIPIGFLQRFNQLWDGVEWLGFLDGTPLEDQIPPQVVRYSSKPPLVELGMGGWEALNQFLSVPQSRGVIGVFSRPERKVSFIKVEK